MTYWPKDDGTLSFRNLTGPVCAAIRDIYSLKRKTHGDIEWTGPATPKFLLSTSLTFEERLSKEMLDYEEYEQGREPLKILVGFAVQLGMEQERRRMACSSDHELAALARGLLRKAAKGLEPTENTPGTDGQPKAA